MFIVIRIGVVWIIVLMVESGIFERVRIILIIVIIFVI